jgi:hypothetical protein
MNQPRWPEKDNISLEVTISFHEKQSFSYNYFSQPYRMITLVSKISMVLQGRRVVTGEVCVLI